MRHLIAFLVAFVIAVVAVGYAQDAPAPRTLAACESELSARGLALNAIGQDAAEQRQKAIQLTMQVEVLKGEKAGLEKRIADLDKKDTK